MLNSRFKLMLNRIRIPVCLDFLNIYSGRGERLHYNWDTGVNSADATPLIRAKYTKRSIIVWTDR